MPGLLDSELLDVLHSQALDVLTARDLCSLAATCTALRDTVYAGDLATWQTAARQALQPCCPRLPDTAAGVRALLQHDFTLNRSLAAGIVATHTIRFDALQGELAQHRLSPSADVLVEWVRNCGQPAVSTQVSTGLALRVKLSDWQCIGTIAWHPDGSQVTVQHTSQTVQNICFSVLEWRSQSWISSYEVPKPPDSSFDGAISPSGLRVVVCYSYLERDSGPPLSLDLRLVDVAGRSLITLPPLSWPYFDHALGFSAAWSPDSTKLAVFGETSLAIYSASTGIVLGVAEVVAQNTLYLQCWLPGSDACIVLTQGSDHEHYSLTRIDVAPLTVTEIVAEVMSLGISDIYR